MPAKQKTLAVTGATGFVGAHFVNLAVREGFTVQALTRRSQDARPGVRWMRGSLADSDSLTALCTGADAVIHIAGVVNAPTRAVFEAGNVAGTLEIVEAAKRTSVPRFIHVSSLAAKYPELSIYGDTKARAEKIVAASGLDWTAVRPPWVYGPGDSDTLDLFKAAKLGFIPLPPNPEGKLSAVHVDDLCRALLALVPSHEDITAQIYEVDDGSKKPWTQADFAKAIGWAIGKRIKPLAVPKMLLKIGAKTDRLFRRDKAKLTADRISYFCHDDWSIDPAKRPPSAIWIPRIATRQGLKDTAGWYKRNDWL